MKSHRLIAGLLLAMLCIAAAPAKAQEVTKKDVPGIVNFAQVETTVACGGAIKLDAVPQLKQMGFVSIINLRQASEPGADLEAEGDAAKSAGIRYYSIPFDEQKPDPAVADKFLDAITTKGSEPAFIHCAGGGRAATMWFIKRLVIDHWDVDRATKEATALGMTNPKLKQFALDYAEAHKR
jgi:uncharacterized protein (TIGR01244 family)